MKNSLIYFLFIAFASIGIACDDNTETPTSNNEPGQNNEKNNKNNQNNEANNAKPECLLSTDCASGICLKGKCKTGGNEECDGSGECGNCDPLCHRGEIGTKEHPFVLDDDPDNGSDSSGVIVDKEGALTIGVSKIDTNYIWIANTREGTISKVDTRTYKEVARYLTGPAGTRNDPSRTSVNTYSDVYVGNRNGRTITKISALGEKCPDSNGDGKITTSTGPANTLPWGQDDCVLWHRSLPVSHGGIRAVAAQDGHSSDQTLKSGVWVGGFNFDHKTNKIWKLDSETGDTLLETSSPSPGGAYGFALDGLGNLWISAYHNQTLSRINTLKCRSTATCKAAVCNGEGAQQDACVKQNISVSYSTYGITVDFKQRVWLGGGNVAVYDPKKDAGKRLTRVEVSVHGIAADEKGWVWGAATGTGLYRLEGDNPSNKLLIPGTSKGPRGVAIDLDGKIWSINLTESTADVIIPGAGLNDNNVKKGIVKGLVSPYTYSDMTGAQLRFVTNERGFYRQVFEGCTGANIDKNIWEEIRWDAETPGNSKIIFRVRGGDTKAELASAVWIEVANIPPDTSPKVIKDLFQQEGIQDFLYVELEAELRTARKPDQSVETPKLKAMAMTHSCPPVHQ